MTERRAKPNARPAPVVRARARGRRRLRTTIPRQTVGFRTMTMTNRALDVAGLVLLEPMASATRSDPARRKSGSSNARAHRSANTSRPSSLTMTATMPRRLRVTQRRPQLLLETTAPTTVLLPHQDLAKAAMSLTMKTTRTKASRHRRRTATSPCLTTMSRPWKGVELNTALRPQHGLLPIGTESQHGFVVWRCALQDSPLGPGSGSYSYLMFSTACISYGVSWGLEEVNMYTRKGPNAVHLAPRSELYTTTMTTY